MAISSVSGASSADFTKSAQAFFNKIDTNGDGVIDKTEFKSGAPKSQNEGEGPDLDQIFSEIDTNSDGQIDESENEAGMQKAGSNGPGGKAGGPPPGGAPPGGAPPSGGMGGGMGGGMSSGMSGTSKSSSSSSNPLETYDEKDTNKDGTVSFQEEVQYNIKHMNDKDKSDSANQSQNDESYDLTGMDLSALKTVKSTFSILV